MNLPRPPSIAVLAWRQTLRDFRAGELRLLAVAVMLAVAALTAVGFFADRLGSGLQRDARQLLGGDAVVGSDQPAPAELAAQAQALGLRVATSVASRAWAALPTTRGAPRGWWRSRPSAHLPAARHAAAARRAGAARCSGGRSAAARYGVGGCGSAGRAATAGG
jgi:hypothetical protein